MLSTFFICVRPKQISGILLEPAGGKECSGGKSVKNSPLKLVNNNPSPCPNSLKKT